MANENKEVAINEAVHLLNCIAPDKLENLKKEFPSLELQEGIFAGELREEIFFRSENIKIPSANLKITPCAPEVSISGDGNISENKQMDADRMLKETNHENLLKEKAKIFQVALEEASTRAKSAMDLVATKIKKARFARLITQIIVLISSSSVLGAMALNAKDISVATAVFTLLAAIGNLLAEYYEKLLNPQTGNIYEVYQRLGEGILKTQTILEELKLANRFALNNEDLTKLLGTANQLCESLNQWLIQVLDRFPSPATTLGTT